MPINFLTQEDGGLFTLESGSGSILLESSITPSDDDDAGGWQGTVQNIAVATALAACVAASTLGANLAQQNRYEQHEPAGSLHGMTEEFYWQHPVASSAGWVVPQFSSTSTSAPVAALEPDEDFWQNPVAPVTYPQFVYTFIDDGGQEAQIVFGLDEDFWQTQTQPVPFTPYVPAQAVTADDTFTSIEDEDFWTNPTKPIAYLPPVQAFAADDTFTSLEDEDFWQNPVAPVASYAPPKVFTDDDIIFVPPIQDEDFWANPTAPVPASLWQRLPLFDVEELPANTLHGEPDEDFWQNPVAPVVASLWQRLPYGLLLDPEEIPAGSLIATTIDTDEDFWQNPVAPVPATLYQSLPYRLPFSDVEELPAKDLFGQPDEDFWLNPVAPIGGYVPPLVFTADDTFTSIRDEDFWENPAAPVPSYLPPPQAITADDTFTAVQDEDFWINPVAPVWSYPVPLLFNADDGFPPPLVFFSDEDYWQSRVTSPSQWSALLFGSSWDIPPQTEFPFLDEDFWINPVAPIAGYVPPKVFSDDDVIEQPPALLHFDEDFWTNPVTSCFTPEWQHLPYLPDPDEIPALSGPAGFQLDEETWRHQVSFSANWIVQTFRSDAATAPGSAPPPFVDDNQWTNPVPPVPLSFGPLYLPDPEELPAGSFIGPTTANPIDEYWINPVSPVPATLWQHLPYLPDPEEIPAGSLIGPAFVPDEDFGGLSQVIPDQIQQILIFLDDGSSITAFEPDEDFWFGSVAFVAPVPSYPVPKVFTDDDVMEHQPIAIHADEDFWENPVPPVWSIFGSLYLPDPEEIPAGFLFNPPVVGEPDEDFWINPVAPVAATNYLEFPYLPDAEEIPAATLYEIDELYWQNQAAPSFPKNFQLLPVGFLPDPDEIPVAHFFGQADEDFWQNPVAPVPATNYLEFPYLPDAEEIPAATLYEIDEDYWENPVAPVWSYPNPIVFAKEDDPITFGMDEDFWTNPVEPVVYFPPVVAITDDEIIAIAPPIQDEDFWINAVAPVFAYPVPVVFNEDLGLIIPPPIQDEDFWLNPVAPIPASNYLQFPYLPDPEEIPAGFLFNIAPITCIGSGTVVPVTGEGSIDSEAATVTIVPSDNFNRANENPIQAPWISSGADGQLLNNAFQSTLPFGEVFAVYDGGLDWPRNQSSQATLLKLAHGSGYAFLSLLTDLRFTDAYQLFLDGVFQDAGTDSPNDMFVHLFRANRTGGSSYLSTGLIGGGPKVGDVFMLQIIGNVITAFRNGVQLFTYTDTNSYPVPLFGPGTPPPGSYPGIGVAIISGNTGDIVWGNWQGSQASLIASVTGSGQIEGAIGSGKIDIT
jgi:hypothetical protein